MNDLNWMVALGSAAVIFVMLMAVWTFGGTR